MSVRSKLTPHPPIDAHVLVPRRPILRGVWRTHRIVGSCVCDARRHPFRAERCDRPPRGDVWTAPAMRVAPRAHPSADMCRPLWIGHASWGAFLATAHAGVAWNTVRGVLSHGEDDARSFLSATPLTSHARVGARNVSQRITHDRAIVETSQFVHHVRRGSVHRRLQVLRAADRCPGVRPPVQRHHRPERVR